MTRAKCECGWTGYLKDAPRHGKCLRLELACERDGCVNLAAMSDGRECLCADCASVAASTQS